MNWPRSNRLSPRTVLGAAGSLLLALTACSSGEAASWSSPAAASSTARQQVTTEAGAGGVRLSELGFRHGPDDFRVPDGLVLTGRVDQDNVVTLLMDQEQGRRVHDYLMTVLPGAGWTIEASSGDSIVFTTSGWEGAFTMTGEQAGLTLRRLEADASPG